MKGKPSGLKKADYTIHDENDPHFKRKVSNHNWHNHFKTKLKKKQIRVMVDGRVFNSIVAAADFLGSDRSNFWRAFKSGRKKYKGHSIERLD